MNNIKKPLFLALITASSAFGMGTVEKSYEFAKKSLAAFCNRPYLEILGTDFPCQRKMIVNAHIWRALKTKTASKDLKELASLVSLLQPDLSETHQSLKTFKRNARDFLGETISNSQAQDRQLQCKALVLEGFKGIWDDIAYRYSGKTVLSPKDQASTILDYFKDQQLPIALAVYIGSPRMAGVMQHRFQAVYMAHYDEALKKWYVPPEFDKRDIARGVAPVAGQAAAVFHMGVPAHIYCRHLQNGRFLKNFPGKNFCGDSPLTRLNLTGIKLDELLEDSFTLINDQTKDQSEPGYEFGMFKYPLSNYHFSFAPCWPEGGHDEYMGRKLEQAMAISMSHQHNYRDENYEPLQVYLEFPNPFAPLEAPGVVLRLGENGKHIRIRLFASKDTRYSPLDVHDTDKDVQRNDKEVTDWVWDFERSYMTVSKKIDAHGQFVPIDLALASEKKPSYYMKLAADAIDAHFKVNFCFKTKFILHKAGITENSDIFSAHNADRFYLNAIK